MLNRVPPPLALSAGANSVSGSGTIVFSNSNSISFGLNGSTLTGSVNIPYTVSDALGMVGIGNTGGTSGLVSNTAFQYVFVGSNNISLSQSRNANSGTLSIFGQPPFSAGASNLGNTAGSTGVTGSRLVLVGSQNITLSQSTDANGATISFSGGAGAAGNTGFLQAGANTASLGTINFSNSNGISFGLNGQTMTGSHNGLTSQSTQFLALTLGGNTSGTTTFNASNNASLFLNGGNNITLSGNGSTVTISAANQTVQTQGITADQLSIGLSTGGNTQGNTTVGTGNRFVLVGTNGITLSQATGVGSTTISISGNAAQTVQPAVNAIGVSNTGATAGNTGTSSGITYVLAGSNLITLSQSTAVGGPNTAWIQHPAWLTTARASTDAVGLNTAQTNVTWTVNSSGISLNAGGYAGTGFTSTTTAGANIVGTNNTAGLSLGVPAYLTTADLSANSSNYFRNWKLTGNTAGTTSSAQGTDLWISGGANITVSGNSNTIVISGGAGGAGGSFSAGASNLGNTAGNTGITGTQLVLVGSGVMSLSQSTGANGGTLSILAPATSSLSATGLASISTNGSTISIGAAGISYLGVSNTGNTAGNTGSSSGIGFVIAGSNNITISQSTTAGGPSTIWVSDAAAGAATLSNYEILGDMNPQAMVTNVTLGQNSLYFVPFDLQAPLNAYRLNLFMSMATTNSAANSTGKGGFTISAALYSVGAGASTDRINTFWSGTAGFAVTQNSNTQIVATNVIGISNSTQVSSVGTSISSSNATTYPANSMGGFRALALPISSTLTPGRYWLAVANSTSSSNAGVCLLNASIMQMSMSNFIAFRPFGTSSAASNASFYPYMPGAGTYSLTSAGFPASIPLTSDSIRISPTYVLPYANFSGYTTGTNLL